MEKDIMKKGVYFSYFRKRMNKDYSICNGVMIEETNKSMKKLLY